MKNTTRHSMKRRFALAGALLTGLLAPVVATSSVASAAGIAVTTATSKYFTEGSSSAVKGIKVTGLEGKQVLGSLTTENGIVNTLTLGTTKGLTLAYGYTSFSGPSIVFTGLQEDVNKALETLTLKTPSGRGQTAITVKSTFTEAKDGLVYSPANQHFYRFVQGKITGTNAYASAASTTEFGLQGYLATINSAEENEFLSRKVEGAKNVWVNGTDSATEGTWKFSGGPEDGTEFWKGWEAEFTANPGAPVNNAFTSWAANEPNNWNNTYHEVENSPALGEDCIVLNKYSPTSAPPNNQIQYEKWNDISCSYGTGPNHLIGGYIVEFGSKTNGSTYDNMVVLTNHTLVKSIPTQKLSLADKIVKFLFTGKKSLPLGFKIFAKPKPTAPKKLCPDGPKKTKLSYTLILGEAGRYSFYFTNQKGKRIPMECGSQVNKRVITEPISAPVIQTLKVNERPVITAYINSSAFGKDPQYPLLNVILRRSDGTLERIDQPVPPLPGAPLATPGVYQAKSK